MPRIALIVTLLWIVQPTPGFAQTAQPIGDPVFIGAGDIASCTLPGDEETAALIDNVIASMKGIAKVTVFTAGDNAYETGSPVEYSLCYNPTWGRFKKITRPAPGNHEYVMPYAIGYFQYFGRLAGPPNLGYYSFDLGAWHLISLDSDQDERIAGYQGKWLQADLKANQGKCILAYWHHPIFSSQGVDTNPRVRDFWTLLYHYGATVVVNGHVHVYERFAPQTPAGRLDPQKGIREFIVGTGGAALNGPFTRRGPNSEVRDNSTWGVIKFTLHPTSYDWEFIPVKDSMFHDSGSAHCVSTSAVVTL